MYRMNLTEFEKLLGYHGVYVFTEKDGCLLCKKFIDSLKTDYSIDDWNIIEVGPYEIDYVRKTYDMPGFPTTVFYYENDIKWKKSGALFSVQMRHLNKTMLEYGPEIIKTIKHGEKLEFDFKNALKKPEKIRCVKIDKPFEVETPKGFVQGNAGDWLVIDSSGKMYPYDEITFNTIFDIKED